MAIGTMAYDFSGHEIFSIRNISVLSKIFLVYKKKLKWKLLDDFCFMKITLPLSQRIDCLIFVLIGKHCYFKLKRILLNKSKFCWYLSSKKIYEESLNNLICEKRWSSSYYVSELYLKIFFNLVYVCWLLKLLNFWMGIWNVESSFCILLSKFFESKHSSTICTMLRPITYKNALPCESYLYS